MALNAREAQSGAHTNHSTVQMTRNADGASMGCDRGVARRFVIDPHGLLRLQPERATRRALSPEARARTSHSGVGAEPAAGAAVAAGWGFICGVGE
jgi:hypothetical protein